jgi:ATP-dependent Lon protease
MEELPEEAKKKINLVFVNRVEPVFELALYPPDKKRKKKSSSTSK